MVYTEPSRKGMHRRLCLSSSCQNLPLDFFKSSRRSCPFWLSASLSFFHRQKLKMCIKDMLGASKVKELITVKLEFVIKELDGVYFFTKTFHQMVIMMLFPCCALCVFVRIPSLFPAKMLPPHTPQLRLMDLTNMWPTDAFTYRTYRKRLCS